MLPPLEESEGMLKNDGLNRKSSRKKTGKSAPLPPRRTTSVKDSPGEPTGPGDLDQELKSRIRIQKAKLDQCSNVGDKKDSSEFVDSGLGMDQTGNNSALLPGRVVPYYPVNASSMTKSSHHTQSPQNRGSPTFAREDKASKTSVENLKAAKIDRTKYLISDANARPFDSNAPERSSSRSLGGGISGMMRSEDRGGGGDFPLKKAILPPQRSAMMQRKKLSEGSLPLEMLHSASVDESFEVRDSPRLGKLDVTNVTKAINRFGTIPKGVRIGAYLESMEREQDSHHPGRDGLPSIEDHDSGTDSASVTSCPPMVGEQFISPAGLMVREGVSEDSDPGIKQEPNLRPSSFVKSQSQQGIMGGGGGGGGVGGESSPIVGGGGGPLHHNQSQSVHGLSSNTVKVQYSGLLHRHKSDLSSSSKPSTPSEVVSSTTDHMITSTTSSTGSQHLSHHPHPHHPPSSSTSSVHRADTDPLSRLVDHSPPQPAPPHSAPHSSAHHHFIELSGSNNNTNAINSNANAKPKPSPRFSRQFGDGDPNLNLNPNSNAASSSVTISSSTPSTMTGGPLTGSIMYQSDSPYRQPAWMLGLRKSTAGMPGGGGMDENSGWTQLNGKTPSNVSSFKMYAKPSISVNPNSKQPNNGGPTNVNMSTTTSTISTSAGNVCETKLDLVSAEACLAAATDSITLSSHSGETVAYHSTGVKLLQKGQVLKAPCPPPSQKTDSTVSSAVDPPQLQGRQSQTGNANSAEVPTNTFSTSEPVNINSIKQASDRLQSCIELLAQAGNKSSTNFLLLSEQVLNFYDLCSQYIDDLPPHAKFHVRELLSRMQTHSQNLKTYTSTTPLGGSHLLDEIKTTNREIMTVIQR